VKRERFKYLGKSLVGTEEVLQKGYIAPHLECTDVSCTDVYRIRARSVGNQAKFPLRPRI